MIPGPKGEADEKAISISNLKFCYEGGVQALSGICLDIREGEYVAIVGGNGSGKTTLAKNIIGLLKPTSGTILVQGVSTENQKVAALARVVGYVYQNPDHQLFCSTVSEEVRFGPRNLGFPESEIEARAQWAIDAMDLERVKDRAPFTLTLSERRRVSIASIVAMNPKILVFDEPTTGLDMRESDSLMERVGRLNTEGRTVVLITHDMKLVAKHARRVVVMSEGRVILDSDPSAVFYDLDALLRSRLVPPPVVRLVYRLSSLGVPRNILSPEGLVDWLLAMQGDVK